MDPLYPRHSDRSLEEQLRDAEDRWLDEERQDRHRSRGRDEDDLKADRESAGFDD